MIESKLILCAIALARHGNFARAAESLGISQPSLSRNIATLERQVGVKLFDRGGRRVIPNAYGEVLLERGNKLVETEESLLRELQMLGSLDFGRLVIGTGPYPADISVGIAVGRLVAAHPRLKVRVVKNSPEQIYHGLTNRELDVGVFDVGASAQDEALHCEPLPEHALGLFCRPGHPLTLETELSVAKILAYPLVTTLLRGDKATLAMAVGISGGHAVTAGVGRYTGDYEPAIHVNALSMACEIASHSDAVYPGPVVVEATRPKASQLVRLDFEIPAMHTGYSLVYLKGRSPSPAASAFISVLLQVEAEQEKREAAMKASFRRRKLTATRGA